VGSLTPGGKATKIMNESLKDQLIALGLAEEKKRAKKKPAAHLSAKKPAKKPEQGDNTALSLEQAYRLRKIEEQERADKARKRKQAEDRRRRQLNKDIRAIVDAHRLNDPNAEITRNFMYKGRIRKIMVTAEQLKSVNAGELGVAYLMGGYHLLTREYTEAIRELSEDHIPDLLAGGEDEGEHPVPDDLIW
jgi:uncharacterized protein YaiL (DUF2058 family)